MRVGVVGPVATLVLGRDRSWLLLDEAEPLFVPSPFPELEAILTGLLHQPGGVIVESL